jgi:hypothetical protein
MKKLIDGKMYNTETADNIAAWSNTYDRGNFHFCEEYLYKTGKGTYFLHGIGGSLSKYAQPSGGTGKCGGEDIEVLTPEKAFEWLQSHDLADIAKREFPERIEEG